MGAVLGTSCLLDDRGHGLPVYKIHHGITPKKHRRPVVGGVLPASAIPGGALTPRNKTRRWRGTCWSVAGTLQRTMDSNWPAGGHLSFSWREPPGYRLQVREGRGENVLWACSTMGWASSGQMSVQFLVVVKWGELDAIRVSCWSGFGGRQGHSGSSQGRSPPSLLSRGRSPHTNSRMRIRTVHLALSVK